MIVVLWRAGLRVSEALALSETDLDRTRGAIHVRQGKGGRSREVGVDPWAFEQLKPGVELRRHPLVAPSNGVTTFHTHEIRPGKGALCTPGTTVLTPTRNRRTRRLTVLPS